MARIPSQRVQIEMDDSALRSVALLVAANTVDAFPVSEEMFRDVVTGRAEYFLAWLHQVNEDGPPQVRTFE